MKRIRRMWRKIKSKKMRRTNKIRKRKKTRRNLVYTIKTCSYGLRIS